MRPAIPPAQGIPCTLATVIPASRGRGGIRRLPPAEGGGCGAPTPAGWAPRATLAQMASARVALTRPSGSTSCRPVRWLASALARPLALAGAALLSALPLAAQSASSGSMALPPILDVSREIALARSAAPASVSGDATVLVLERGKGYVTAVEGASGVTCFVDRTWPESIEPHCFDREASATILVLRLRFAELRERGGTMAEWEREREEGIRAGRFRLPSRPALTWMMSAGQVLHDDEGVFVGSWRPHVMIYYPGLAAEDLGLAGEPHAHGPWLSDAREPTSTLVVPMPEFVDVEGAAAGPAGPGAGARPEGGA